MALIECPECSKEISDKVKNCPHCGYPLVEDDIEAQKVEATAVRLKKDEGEKKRLIKIVSIFVIGIIAFGSYYIYTTQQAKKTLEEYETNFDLIVSQMLSGAADSEELMNLTIKVWENAITGKQDTETDKYTSINGNQVSDFNDALDIFFADSKTEDSKMRIMVSNAATSSIMEEMYNPPEKYKNAYSTLTELYIAYKEVTDLAINPNGSLNTFKEDKNKEVENFIDLYERLEAQRPQ